MSVLYISKIITISVVKIDILMGVFIFLYYYIRYGDPESGNKKWESQKVYRSFYISISYIVEGIIIITLFVLTNFLYDKNLSLLDVTITEVLCCFALPLVGLFIGEYYRSKKFHLSFRYVFLNGPKK